MFTARYEINLELQFGFILVFKGLIEFNPPACSIVLDKKIQDNILVRAFVVSASQIS